MRVPGLNLDSWSRRLRELGGDAAMVARLTRDLPRYLRNPMHADQVRAGIVARLASRPERLLGIVEQTIYRNPKSPYLALFRMAGCELGDLRALVRQEGVEGALLDELGRDGASSRYHAGIWRSARTIEVRREPPLATRAGKVLPFHLLRRTEEAPSRR